MRLLNTASWQMQDFVSDDAVPPYAILSHTWGQDEISFQQWETRESVNLTQLRGYRKIKNFGERAAVNGFEWIWVDT